MKDRTLCDRVSSRLLSTLRNPHERKLMGSATNPDKPIPDSKKDCEFLEIKIKSAVGKIVPSLLKEIEDKIQDYNWIIDNSSDIKDPIHLECSYKVYKK